MRAESSRRMPSRPRAARRAALALLVSAAAISCRSEPPADSAAEGPAPAVSPGPNESSRTWAPGGNVQSLRLGDGTELTLTRTSRGFDVRQGDQSWGRIDVDADRVKVHRDGSERAKAKVKPYGYKIYDGDRELFKIKRRGAGYSVRRSDDSEIALIEAGASQANRVLSLPELTLEQRLAAWALQSERLSP